MFDFNPIQTGADFAAFHESEIENQVRDMVNALHIGFKYHSVPIKFLEVELEYLGLDYASLSQRCKDMIDELDICY